MTVQAIPLCIQHPLGLTALLALRALSQSIKRRAFRLLDLISIRPLVAFWKALVNNGHESWPRWPLR